MRRSKAFRFFGLRLLNVFRPYLLAWQIHPQGILYWVENVMTQLEPSELPLCLVQVPGSIVHVPQGSVNLF